LSKSGAHEVRNKVEEVALKQGMISIPDNSGTNIDVQILMQINWANSSFPANFGDKKPVLIVMDYAFGEQVKRLTSY
jgi:hypothetical protein